MVAQKNGFGNCGRPAEAGTGIAKNGDAGTPESDALEATIAEGPSEMLHGLNNALVSILLNAQVIEWKLPSYTRLKRNLHEVERSAQRGAKLVARLHQWLEANEVRGGGSAA
jgi:hypothetical protein